jgi:hypothetical protein
MRVYDVEVLGVRIDDEAIEEILTNNQHKTVKDTVELMQARKLFEITKEKQDISRKMIEETCLTELKSLDLQTQVLTNSKAQIQSVLDTIANSENARKKAEDDRRLDRVKQQSAIFTEAHEKRMAAIKPDLIAAINNLGDKQLAQALVENLPKATGDVGPIFGIGALKNVIQMVAGTKMEKTLRDVSSIVQKSDTDPEDTPAFDDEGTSTKRRK